MLFNVEVGACKGEIYIYYTEITYVIRGVSKVYDGTPLYTTAESVVFTADTLAEFERLGITYNFSNFSSATNVGERVLAKCDMTFFDADGNDCTEFIITSNSCGFGTLDISSRPITLKPADITVKKADFDENHPFYYDDGENIYVSFPKSFTQDEIDKYVNVESGNFVEGHYIDSSTLSINGQVLATKSINSYSEIVKDSIVIRDTEGNDVTKNYHIEVSTGNFSYTTRKN